MKNINIAENGPANKSLNASFVRSSKVLIDLLLSMNTHNRKIKKVNINFLVAEIENNRWCPTSQGIGVSEDGVIIDGGHRLEAMKQAGYPEIDFLLVTGLPVGAQKYVDQHAKRSMVDTLKLFIDRDVSNQLVAAINVIAKNDNGWKSIKMGPDETVAIIEKYSESIEQVMSISRATSFPAPILAAILKKHHDNTRKDIVLKFAEDVLEGAMLEKGRPALTFRNWCASYTGKNGGQEVQKERFQKTNAAINAALDGRKISRLCASSE